jgi:hypothetical protein
LEIVSVPKCERWKDAETFAIVAAFEFTGDRPGLAAEQRQRRTDNTI